MKVIVLFIALLSSPFASAGFTCTATDVSASQDSPTRQGRVVVTQNPFSIRWEDETLELTGQHTLCGVILNRSTMCQTFDGSRGSALSYRVSCADAGAGPLADKVGESTFNYDLGKEVGRFACSASSETSRHSQALELTNCR